MKMVKWLLVFALITIVAVSFKLTYLPASKSKLKIGRIFVHVEQDSSFPLKNLQKLRLQNSFQLTLGTPL